MNHKSYKLKINSFCIKCIVGSTLFIMIATSMRIYSLLSASVSIIYLAFLMCSILEIIRFFNSGIKKSGAKIWAMAVVFAIFIPIIKEINMNILDVIANSLHFMLIPMAVLFYENISNIVEVKDFICQLNFIGCLYHCILSFTTLSHVYYYGDTALTVDFLTLGYSNPNQTGMLVLVMNFILFISICRTTKIVYKVIQGVVWLYMVYLIFQTESRICMLLVLAVPILYIFKLYNKISVYVIIGSMLIPVLLVVFEVFLHSILMNFELFGEAITTGRDTIFINFFKRIDVLDFWFGDLGLYSVSNLHNSYLTIFARGGIIMLVSYLIMLYMLYMQMLKKVQQGNKSEKIALYSLLLITVHGSVEAAFFSGGTMYAGLFCMLMILTMPDKNEEKMYDCRNKYRFKW